MMLVNQLIMAITTIESTETVTVNAASATEGVIELTDCDHTHDGHQRPRGVEIAQQLLRDTPRIQQRVSLSNALAGRILARRHTPMQYISAE